MAVTSVDNWEYARLVYIVGRSLRINPAAAGSSEETAANTFIANMIAKRSWLQQRDWEKSNNFDSASEPNTYYGEMIASIGKDLQSILLQDDTEKGYCDTLFTATGNRKYGNLGGPGGAEV